jgi:hypothetical protein
VLFDSGKNNLTCRNHLDARDGTNDSLARLVHTFETIGHIWHAADRDMAAATINDTLLSLFRGGVMFSAFLLSQTLPCPNSHRVLSSNEDHAQLLVDPLHDFR